MLLLATFLFFIITIYNQRLSFLIILAILPTYLIRFEIGFLPVTFLETMIIILTLVWLTKIIYHQQIKQTFNNIKKCLNKTFVVLVFLFLLSATISIFVSPNTPAALGLWKAYFIEPIFLFLIGLSLFKNSDTQKIISALGISALLVGLLAVWQNFTGDFVPWIFWGKNDIFRVTSFFGFPNAIGLLLAPIIPLLFYLFKSNQKNKWLPTTLIIILSITSLFFAHSTGALIGLAGGTLISLLFIKKIRWLSIFIILVILAGLIFNFIPPKFSNEILLRDWSGYVRKTIWLESRDMLQANPILGAGLAGYQQTFFDFHKAQGIEIFLYPHNILLNFWSEIGLLGLLSFLGLIIFFYFKTFQLLKNNKPLALVLIASMSALLIHGLVDVPYFKNDLSILFWTLFLISLINSPCQKTNFTNYFTTKNKTLGQK